MKKLFYVIYIKDEVLKTLIDGIRLFIDPSQKYKAHLTVRGPYKKLQKQYQETWNKNLSDGLMEIKGIGKFFAPGQNTIYLDCVGTTNLKTVWNKKDYPDFNPHITLYNGLDRDYAIEVLSILDPFKFHFHIDADELQVLRSPIEKNTISVYGEPYVYSAIEKDLLEELLDGEMPHSVDEISKELRFYFIKKLAELLSKKTSGNNLKSSFDIPSSSTTQRSSMS